MKTTKSLTEAEITELPKLPEGWEWARFEEITENFDGKRKPLSSKFRESFKGEYPYYGACDIIDSVREYIFDGEYLLIGEDGANLLSKSKPLAFSVKGKFWVNNHAHILKAANGVNQKYLEFQFNALQINKYVTGTAQPKLNQSNLNRISIAICSLPEQRAIVSKIELLFSELDNGIVNLKLAQEQLKVYRQAVLKKAFEGELTKKWREQQTDLPDTGDLLEQIRKEREEAAKATGKKLKQVYPLTEVELSELPKVPEGWKWVRLEEISNKITDGEHITPKRTESGYYLLSARNIQNGYLDLKNVDYVPTEEYFRIRNRCNPEEGDILISCSGSIGRICSVPKNSEFVMVRSAALVKLSSKLKLNRFFEYQLQSPLLQSQIEKGKKATAQANLFLGPISNLKVVLCSSPERHAIVQEIETRLSVCDKIEQDIKENLEKAEALRQSILKKAFEGKLLNERELAEARGAEDWEPAEVLLERIRKERARK